MVIYKKYWGGHNRKTSHHDETFSFNYTGDVSGNVGYSNQLPEKTVVLQKKKKNPKNPDFQKYINKLIINKF